MTKPKLKKLLETAATEVDSMSKENTVDKLPMSVKANVRKKKVSRSKPVNAKKTPAGNTDKDTKVSKSKPRKITNKNPEPILDASVVKLPNNMSVRAVEKTAVIKSDFDQYIRTSMYKIAYVSGLCFILVGSSFAATQFVSPDIAERMTGLASNADTTVGLTSVTTKPELFFIDAVPAEILETFKATFTVTNASRVEVSLVALGSTESYLLATEILADSKYTVSIDAKDKTPGLYQLKIYAKPLQGDTDSIFESTVFQLGESSVPEVKSTISDASTVVESGVERVGLDAESEPAAIVKEKETDPSTVADDSLTTEVKSTFSLNISAGSVLSGTEMIPVSVPDGYLSVELYARPLNSLDSLYIAKAVKSLDSWSLSVNTKNLPDGEYEFFATSNLSDGLKMTDSVQLKISNGAVAGVTDTPVAATVSSEDGGVVVRNFVSIAEPEPSAQDDYQDIDITTDDLWEENSVEIEALLERYATAQQSGDEMLISLAAEELDKFRDGIVSTALLDSQLGDSADDIDKILSDKIQDTKQRIETFEKIRSDKSAGETSIDTDSDGISDFDEINLYDTDPNVIDTDNDGITDGIEIMRGFNPTDSAPEAIIEFESPKESLGLIRSDVLEVSDVLPVVQADESAGVKAEIRGRALPNSFITLFIFSTPTVVTIRTDADGQFVYTFDKELEDGMHDVYVAMTDNAGEIIAQSNPFSFIKNAQAFTPVDAAETGLITPQPISDSSRGSYSVVVGMGILAFGLILLMLGISLRKKEDSDGEDGGNEDREENGIDGAKFEHIDAS